MGIANRLFIKVFSNPTIAFVLGSQGVTTGRVGSVEGVVRGVGVSCLTSLRHRHDGQLVSKIH